MVCLSACSAGSNGETDKLKPFVNSEQDSGQSVQESSEQQSKEESTEESLEEDSEESVEESSEESQKEISEESQKEISEESQEDSSSDTGRYSAYLEDDTVKLTAEDLIDKSLSEIAEIMGDDFICERKDFSPAFGTGGGTLMIYDVSSLPGMAFHPASKSGMSQDYDEGEDVKNNIKEGKYYYDGIALYDEGKLNQNISANMTYNEVCDIIGYFDCKAAASETLMFNTDVDGNNVTFCFTTSNDEVFSQEVNKRINNGVVSKEDMKSLNPQLHSIAVFKNTESTSSKSDTQYSDIFKTLPDSFSFSSGVGGWQTVIELNEDGTFTGEFYDYEVVFTGEDYPKGTVYICNFNGKFTDVNKIDDHTYSMRLDYINTSSTEGDSYIEDGWKYIYSNPYGFDNAEEFMIYLPGSSLDSLPKILISWLHLGASTPDTLPSDTYALYNVNSEYGFVGKK